MWKSILLIGLGGGIGSIFRFLISNWTKKQIETSFPWPTLIVNLSGCLLIGFILGFAMKWQSFENDLRFLLIIGFCGGYTTFSTFALENLDLYNEGKFSVLLLYTLSSVLLGIVLVAIGLYLSKIMST